MRVRDVTVLVVLAVAMVGCGETRAILPAIADKWFWRSDTVNSGFAVIVSRRAMCVSHHAMTLNVISGMNDTPTGMAPVMAPAKGMAQRAAGVVSGGAAEVWDGKM